MTHLVQNLKTREFAPAEFSVMFAATGYCGNTHFCTIEDAQAEYDRQLAEVVAIYKSVKVTANYQLTEIAEQGRIIHQTTIVNIKKNGERGKIKNTVRLFRLNA